MNYTTMHAIYRVLFLEYNKSTIKEMTENNKNKAQNLLNITKGAHGICHRKHVLNMKQEE